MVMVIQAESRGSEKSGDLSRVRELKTSRGIWTQPLWLRSSWGALPGLAPCQNSSHCSGLQGPQVQISDPQSFCEWTKVPLFKIKFNFLSKHHILTEKFTNSKCAALWFLTEWTHRVTWTQIKKQNSARAQVSLLPRAVPHLISRSVSLVSELYINESTQHALFLYLLLPLSITSDERHPYYCM